MASSFLLMEFRIKSRQGTLGETRLAPVVREGTGHGLPAEGREVRYTKQKPTSEVGNSEDVNARPPASMDSLAPPCDPVNHALTGCSVIIVAIKELAERDAFAYSGLVAQRYVKPLKDRLDTCAQIAWNCRGEDLAFTVTNLRNRWPWHKIGVKRRRGRCHVHIQTGS